MTKLKDLPKNKQPAKLRGNKSAFTRTGSNYSKVDQNSRAEIIDIRSLMQAVDELVNQNKLASRLDSFIAKDANAFKQASNVFPEFAANNFFPQLIKLFKLITVGKIDRALPEQIQMALRDCAHIFLQTVEAPWQLILLPMISHGKFVTISCYLKDTDYLPPDDDRIQVTYKKFIIEFEHDLYEHMRIEGVYSQEHVNKLQLEIKTPYSIPETKENPIRELFKKETAASNICGTMSFSKLTGLEEKPFGPIAQHYCLSKVIAMAL